MATNQQLTELHLEDIEARPWAAASPWLRLIGFAVDSFLFYVSLFALNFVILLFPAMAFHIPVSAHQPLAAGLPSLFAIFYTGICTVLYVLYYTLQETWLSGQTLGKRFTGTEAIPLAGGRIQFTRALVRSLYRLIPFDGLFALTAKGPLHDRLSHTTVVRL